MPATNPTGFPALCCQCGALNHFTKSGRVPRGHLAGDATSAYNPEVGRCVILRKCGNCNARAIHAYLRTDEHRDNFEVAIRKAVA